MKLNKILKSFIFTLSCLMLFILITPTKINAASLTLNGTFEAEVDLDLRMGADAFSKKVIIEHMDDNYYLTFTQVDSSNLANMKLIKDGNVGVMLKEEGNSKSYTYTLSLEDLNAPLRFGVTVTVMNKYVEFDATIKMDTLKYKSDTIEDRGERPARFIPVITTNATNQEVEKGTNYFIPTATATLKNQEVEVKVNAYYENNNTLKEIKIENGKIKLDLLGEYIVKYSVSSDLFKTSLGNPTTSEFTISIQSKVGASSISKVEDINNILPKGYQAQTTILTSGDTFDKVSTLMKGIADNYQVFSFTLFNEDGSEITLNGEIKLYLRADDYFNRQEIEVYHLNDDNTTTLVEEENYGRYISFNTKDTGTYIVLVPGVKFVMPIMGYAIIAVVGFSLVTLGIVLPILIHKKNKKKQNSLD